MSTRIYIADTEGLQNSEIFERILSYMPEYRKEKIKKIKFEDEKRRSLAVGELLRRACIDFGIQGADMKVRENEYGKRVFFEDNGVHFNLSHSKNRAVCIIADRECGADVEKMKEVNLKVSARSFTKEEHASIVNADSEAKMQSEFFRLWTLKESYMKATGLGFKLFPNMFSIDTKKNPAVLQKSTFDSDYSFFELLREDGYKYSFCEKGNEFDSDVEVIDVSFDYFSIP